MSAPPGPGPGPERRTEALVEQLARGLAPVRPVPRLRTAVLAGLAVGALAGAIPVQAKGLRLPLLEVVLREPAFAPVALGLALLAPAALVAGLARAFPGRDVAAVGAWRLALLGLAVALGGGAVALAWQGALATPFWEAAPSGRRDWLCFAQGTLLALPAAGLAVWLLRRGTPFAGASGTLRELASPAWVALGAVATGALATHLTCRASGARHVLLAHAAAPLAGAALLAPLGWAWLRHRRSAAASGRSERA